MKRTRKTTHVPLNSRFVLTMLAVDFVLIVCSFLGMIGTIAFFSPAFWLCVFVTTIAGTFFIAGLVSIGSGFAFLHRLPLLERTDATVVGWHKEKRRGRSALHYVSVYYPKLSYRIGGTDYTHISNTGSNSPKHEKGETVLLLVDTKTGAAVEKRDCIASFAIGAIAAIIGGVLTSAVWLAYFSGWLAMP